MIPTATSLVMGRPTEMAFRSDTANRTADLQPYHAESFVDLRCCPLCSNPIRWVSAIIFRQVAFSCTLVLLHIPISFCVRLYILTFKFNNDHRIGYKTSELEARYEVAEFDPFYLYWQCIPLGFWIDIYWNILLDSFRSRNNLSGRLQIPVQFDTG